MINKLKSFENQQFKGRSVLLIIMDGVGIGRNNSGDCVFHAKTPNLDDLTKWAKKSGVMWTLIGRSCCTSSLFQISELCKRY